MRKRFIHIKEYDLTKLLIDRLEIDIEDEFELFYDISPLYYKDKKLILPEYTQYSDYYKTGTVLRPFINVSHAQYLINMFSDIKSRNALFEYIENDDGTLNGTLYITDDGDYKREVNFYGIKNLSVLMSAVLLKTLCGHEAIRGIIKDIFKIDKKMSMR